METYSIFIVEDDPWYAEILDYHLSLNPDYRVTRFASAKELLGALHQQPDLITVDYALPDSNGLDLVKKIRALNADVPVIVISSQENVATAVELLKMGVNDYLVKDDNTKDLLWNAIIRIRENQCLKKEVEQLRVELGQKYEFEKIIKGNSAAIRQVFSLMEKATLTNINVSINGETGTGKELVAKAIHYNSPRKKKPFVAVNMAAIPKELVESELFGHEKGAFTGAMGRRLGKFEEADKGTIFLDEIGELELSMQSKLLRVLQERELTRIGGNEKVKLDVRVIIATHRNLADEVQKGNFREDLYYRVMGMPIVLPPLRDRGDDILLLAKNFVDEFCKESKMPLKSLTEQAREKLMKHTYPGNVRELKSVVELAAALSNGSDILPEDISFGTKHSNNYFLAEEKTMKEYYVEIVEQFLRKYKNNVVQVADRLEIGKSTIYKMIQQKEILLPQ